MPPNKIRLLLVDDHVIARSGVKLLLEPEGDIQIVGEADNLKDAIRMLGQHDFDVALVDISIHDENGLDLLPVVQDKKPKMKVLMLSSYEEEVYALRALKLGASGYLSKKADRVVLVEAIRKVAAGRRYISPAIAEKVVDIANGSSLNPIESLSNRELEILKLIASGMSLNNIAIKLHVSPSTVTTHRRRILDKTGLNSNAELAHYARETKILN